MEKKKDIVTEVIDKRKELIEHKYDAKNDDTTGIRINGKEVKIEKDTPAPVTPSTPTTNNSNNGGNSKAVIIVVIIVGSILLLGLLGFAGYSIYSQFMSSNPKPTPTTPDKPTTPKTPSTPSNNDDWYINYDVPGDFEEASYSSKTLKMYKYRKDGIMCSLTTWKITYVPDGNTEEDMLIKYGSISKTAEAPVKDVKINGKTWKYREDLGSWSKYEFGVFDKTGENFYIIKYQDYDSDKPTCKNYLNQVIKSISYNK